MIQHLPSAFLSIFLINILVRGVDLNSAIVMLALSGIYALHYFTESKKAPKVNTDVYEKIEKLEAEVKIHKEKISSITLMNLKR